MPRLAAIVCLAVASCISGVAGHGASYFGRKQSPSSKAPVIRWFALLKYKAGTNLTAKTEGVAFAVSKCTKYFYRAAIGQDLGYATHLYFWPNYDIGIVIDFVNAANIQPFDKCIDANNPTPGFLNEGIAGDANVALTLPAAHHWDGCGRFPGCTGGITQLLAFRIPNFNTNATVATEFIAALDQAFLDTSSCLTSYHVAGNDATPFPPTFLGKHQYTSYEGYDSVAHLRATWSLLSGKPGPEAPEIKMISKLLNGSLPTSIQFIPGPTIVGEDMG